jgi:hypothetical protein
MEVSVAGPVDGMNAGRRELRLKVRQTDLLYQHAQTSPDEPRAKGTEYACPARQEPSHLYCAALIVK